MRRRAVPALLLALVGTLGAGLTGQGASEASATGPFCSLTGMTTNTWTGAGDGTTWELPDNWSTHQVPDNTDESSGYVCIDAHGPVVMGDSIDVRIQAIDIASGTTLTINRGDKLFVYGDQATRPSVVRSGATVNLLGSSLGGSGRIDLDGLLRWRSLADGAATISSRRCVIFAAACTEPTGPGTMVVGDGGQVRVDGLGVNLFDGYRLVVRGTLSLLNQGFVSADRGTSLELRPQAVAAGVGTFDIRNDGGFYEGFDRGLTSLAGFVNEGLIHKRIASGTSTISASYSRVGAGSVQVSSGTLTLPQGASNAARVLGGRSYGSGTCGVQPAYGCVPRTDTDDDQNGRFTVPAVDSSGADVKVKELGASAAGDIGVPLLAHADGLTATRAKPALLTLRYDASLLGGRTWRQVRVYRQATAAAPWVKLPACSGTGRPLAPAAACVDRRGKPASSRNVYDEGPLNPPDVVMVVRTIRTSRWVAR